jgi:hypothetical protein
MAGAVTFAYQKPYIHSAFHGTHALIWAQQLSGLFRVHVIMTLSFASAAPRKLSIWGEEREDSWQRMRRTQEGPS